MDIYKYYKQEEKKAIAKRKAVAKKLQQEIVKICNTLRLAFDADDCGFTLYSCCGEDDCGGKNFYEEIINQENVADYAVVDGKVVSMDFDGEWIVYDKRLTNNLYNICRMLNSIDSGHHQYLKSYIPRRIRKQQP